MYVVMPQGTFVSNFHHFGACLLLISTGSSQQSSPNNSMALLSFWDESFGFRLDCSLRLCFLSSLLHRLATIAWLIHLSFYNTFRCRIRSCSLYRNAFDYPWHEFFLRDILREKFQKVAAQRQFAIMLQYL